MLKQFSEIFNDVDRHWMQHCLSLAESTARQGEVPIAAVLVDHYNTLVGEGCNRCILDNDPTAHAEIIAIRAACTRAQNYRLADCTLYVTVEPCPMCFGAIVNARVSRLVYAASEPRTGACGSCVALHTQLNHSVSISRGLMAEQAAALMQRFFENKRGQGND